MAKRQGSVERRVRSQLRAAGWTADAASEAGTLGAMAIDLAQTQDETTSARDKAAINRELRMTLQAFRALADPAEGDAVDEAAHEPAGGQPGTEVPDRPVDSNVRPFGRRRAQAG